jgi:hypothetical protein
MYRVDALFHCTTFDRTVGDYCGYSMIEESQLQ